MCSFDGEKTEDKSQARGKNIIFLGGSYRIRVCLSDPWFLTCTLNLFKLSCGLCIFNSKIVNIFEVTLIFKQSGSPLAGLFFFHRQDEGFYGQDEDSYWQSKGYPRQASVQ
jgi:hypothetical protein